MERFFSQKQQQLHYPYGQPKEHDRDVVWICEAKSYSYIIDADREEYGSTAPVIELTFHHVKRRTAKCAVLQDFSWQGDRLLRLYSRRCPFRNTPEEALAQFHWRRQMQVKILQRQLDRAQYELDLVEQFVLKEKTNEVLDPRSD